MVVSPEDSILSKLEWMKLSESDRQLADVNGVIAVTTTIWTGSTFEHWVVELGLQDELARTRRHM